MVYPDSKNGKGSAVMLTFPDVFFLTPKFVDVMILVRLKENQYNVQITRTKLCALTGLTINIIGQLQTVFDGTIPVVTMELQFKETTKLTRRYGRFNI